MNRSARSCGEELALDVPGLAVGGVRFAPPVEEVGRDLGEPPAGWRAARAHA